MIESAVLYMQSIIANYGAWGVFLATLLEEIVAPIPSPIVPLAAGFFLLPSDLSYVETILRGAFAIALPVAAGVGIGSSAVYALGYFGGKPIIERTARWTGIKWNDVERVETQLTRGRSDEIVLFTLRLLPIIPGVAISGLCGLVRYPFATFIGITLAGSFIRAFFLGLLGWQVGELYATYASQISHWEDYLLVAFSIVALAAAYLFRARLFGTRAEI